MMKFNDKEFLAQQIRTHRKKLGLTQEELAERVDLSVQHVSRIENGCYIPSLNSFFMIAEELKIDLRIFGYGEHKSENETKDRLIKKIIQATDVELIFYEKMTEAISQGLKEVNRRLF